MCILWIDAHNLINKFIQHVAIFLMGAACKRQPCSFPTVPLDSIFTQFISLKSFMPIG